jgi:putative aldouronate transport system permease protein
MAKKAKAVNTGIKYNEPSLGKRIIKARQLYLLLALPILYLLIFAYYPMTGLQIAFKNYKIADGIWGSDWVGFKHFIKLFSDYNFKKIIVNTLRLSLLSVSFNVFSPVILALALNTVRSYKLKKVVQTITYLPHFISIVVMVGILTQLFNPITGIYGHAYTALTGNRAPDILGSPTGFLWMYIFSGVWSHAGYNAVVYIAALAGCDQELHEAAQIDGASRLQRVWHIDIPTILPTVVIMLILQTGRIMGVGFEKAYLMQNPLNQSYSELISTYVYKKAFGTGGNFSYSTAIGLFNSIVNMILVTTVNKISKKVTNSSLW